MKYFKMIGVSIILILVAQNIGYSEIFCKIKGRVIDEETQKGIPDVGVEAHFFFPDSPRNYHVQTDANGYFTFSNIKAGRYCLNYYPLYPYMVYPSSPEPSLYDEKRSFVLNEGENRYFEQKLKKGAEFTYKINSSIINIGEYDVSGSNSFLIKSDRLTDYNSTCSKMQNKKFEYSFSTIKYSWKLSGLEEGKYIACYPLQKKKEFYTGNDFDFAGVIKIFDLCKLEQKFINFDYNATSKLIVDIMGEEGSKFKSGDLDIYKEININNTILYYPVWGAYYSIYSSEKLNPILIEPGKYLIKTDGLLYGNYEGTRYYYENYFLIEIKEGETKKLNLKVATSGNWDQLPELKGKRLVNGSIIDLIEK